MARIRSVKPEIHTDSKTGTLSDRGFRIFVGLLHHADDVGVVEADWLTLKAQVLPFCGEKPEKALQPILTELLPRGLVMWFSRSRKEYYWIPNFSRHQVINKPSLPKISTWHSAGLAAKLRAVLDDNSPSTMFQFDEDDSLGSIVGLHNPSCSPIVPLPDGKEIGNRIGEEEDTPLPPQGGTAFDRFWKTYPKKVGKKAAQRAFKNADAPIEKILGAVEAQRKTEQWLREGGRFIPNPSTWLHQGRWDDAGVDKPTPTAPAPIVKTAADLEWDRRYAEEQVRRKNEVLKDPRASALVGGLIKAIPGPRDLEDRRQVLMAQAKTLTKGENHDD